MHKNSFIYSSRKEYCKQEVFLWLLTKVFICKAVLFIYFVFSHLSQSLSIFCNFFIYFFSSSGIHQSNHLHEWNAIASNSLSIYFLYTLHYFYLLHQVKSLFARFLSILGKTNQSGTWKTIIKSFFGHPKGFIAIRAIFQHRRIFWNKTFTNFVGSSSNLGNVSTNI